MKKNVTASSFSNLNRRSLLQWSAAALSAPMVAKATHAWAEEKLAGAGEVVVFSWGGSFTDAVRKYVYEPFTSATGIKVIDVVADFAEPQIKAMHEAGRVDWDIAYLAPQNYPEMHQAGMFEPINYSLWDKESLDGVPPQARLEDVFAIDQSAELLAYDKRAFPNGGPKNWADFWDVKRFPGPRGLMASSGNSGKFNIQYALLASGASLTDIWPLTDEKMDIAFKKLDEIKPHIAKWWSAGGEPVQLLVNKELVMTSIYDGRVVKAARDGAPIDFSWDGAYIGYDYAAILKGGPNTENAQKLVAFLNRAQIAAGWTQGTGYPATNANQLKYLPTDLASVLSIDPKNSEVIVIEDSAWLTEKRSDGKTNSDHIQDRWMAWRAG